MFDSVMEIDSEEIKKVISVIGLKFGLGPSWLNDQASTVTIPEGALQRAVPIEQWNAIKASIICRLDLIKMKASAFSIRRDQTNKDWEDLLILEPTKLEIKEAIQFIRKINSPPSGASKKDSF